MHTRRQYLGMAGAAALLPHRLSAQADARSTRVAGHWGRADAESFAHGCDASVSDEDWQVAAAKAFTGRIIVGRDLMKIPL